MSPPRSARHVLGATVGAVLALTGCQEPGAADVSRGNAAARPVALAAYGQARLAGARDDEKDVLTHLRQARERAGARWYPEEVLAAPLFERFRRDTGLRAVVGSP
jgi:hypothetical protein